MSDAMVSEEGLLNHAQAALMLDVSTKRVGELVRLGKLRRERVRDTVITSPDQGETRENR
jgi:hypothetical protein